MIFVSKILTYTNENSVLDFAEKLSLLRSIIQSYKRVLEIFVSVYILCYSIVIRIASLNLSLCDANSNTIIGNSAANIFSNNIFVVVVVFVIIIIIIIIIFLLLKRTCPIPIK